MHAQLRNIVLLVFINFGA